MTTRTRATVEQLYHIPENGKAEIIDGEIVRIMPTGGLPSLVGGAIYASLRAHMKQTRSGYAFPDNAGFVVDLPHRGSFSPDAAWHPGPLNGMKFVEGAPTFAVEVRSEGDYGPTAETTIAAKRRDYFAAGTLVVWDVDPLGENVVTIYRSNSPDAPTIKRRGDIADAEPAVPGWSIPVDELFE